MKSFKGFSLPPQVEAEIKAMASADFRTYESELAHLVRRGLRIEGGRSLANEACLLAQLAYLRSEQVEESNEG